LHTFRAVSGIPGRWRRARATRSGWSPPTRGPLPHLFVTEKGSRFTEGTLRRRLYDWVREGRLKKSDVKPHDLGRTFGTQYLQENPGQLRTPKGRGRGCRSPSRYLAAYDTDLSTEPRKAFEPRTRDRLAQMPISVVIPTLNEASCIGPLLELLERTHQTSRRSLTAIRRLFFAWGCGDGSPLLGRGS
jgi:hypothetical protein